MNIANSNSTYRSWYWLTLVPMVLGASLALLQYGGWCGIYSAYYGLPSDVWRLKEAGPKAEFYGWMLVSLTSTATIVATILIPSLKSETLPVLLSAVLRFCLAATLVISSILVVAYGLSALGH